MTYAAQDATCARTDNPNLHGRRAWTAGAPVQYDRSAAASLKFHAWTQQWAEAVWRVLKPGAHAVVCASPRMGHRVTCGLEDAGFEIRDSLFWLYGSGFPKSLNLPGGRGTALKPAYEPIILARKPLGRRTVAQCVAEFGTGALNIDGCRLSTDGRPLRVGDYKDTGNNTYTGRMNGSLQGGSRAAGQTDFGRWPPNVALDEDAAAILDADGGTSRFFYCPKASREERERGCEDLPRKTAGNATGGRKDGSAGLNSPRAGAGRTGGVVKFAAVEERWVREALDRVVQTGGHSRPQRAIGAYTTPDLNDCAWSMCWCGSPSTDPFHPDIRSTIETATSWITGSRTCSWSTRPHTNGCMAAALGVMVAGGSLADFVENPSPWILSTGTSARKAGPVTDAVDRATSVKSWLTSKPGSGGGRRVGVRNSHPT